MFRSSLLLSCAFLTVHSTAFAQSVEQDNERVQEYFEQIEVSALPQGKTTFELAQGASILRGEALRRNFATTLGQTLDALPGINQSFFGPGSSRPLIRGLGADRIRVLVSGIGTLDVSTTSVDHQSAVDLQTAEAVEVIRGPATLIYGTNAAGGIVNIVDNRIPREAPEDGYAVSGGLGYGTNADEFFGSADATAALSDSIVVNLSASYTNSDDYDIPGFLESERLRAAEEAEGGEEEEGEEEVFGTAPNSATENIFVSGGISTIGDWGFLGVAVSYYESDYGIPTTGEEEDEEEESAETAQGFILRPQGGGDGEIVTIGLEQIRVDVAGEYRFAGEFLDKAKFRFGWADYEQTEFEGDEVGTVFDNKEWEGRLEFVQTERNGLSGAFGLQIRNRDFSAIGAEAFVPPNDIQQYGIFIAQTLDTGSNTFSFGARYDRQETEAEFIPIEGGRLPGLDRSFNLFSVSGSAARMLSDAARVSVNLFRTERAPNAEELFSGGPHLATQVFEVGDPNLDKETGFGGEISLRNDSDWFDAEVAFFYTNYNNFIFLDFTGEIEDGLPEAEFGQTDATFYGVESFAKVHLYETEDEHVHLEIGADWVRAEDDDRNQPLPRIPPFTLRTAIDYHNDLFDARADFTYAGEKNNVSPTELVTDDFFRIDLSVDVHPFEDYDVSFLLQARNVTDEEIRYHASFLKETLPAPGRDFRFSVRFGF